MAQSRIAVIGPRDSVLLWRTLGMQAVFVESGEEARRAVAKLHREGCALIYITEDLAEQIGDVLARYASDPSLAIIPIPDKNGTNGLSMKMIRSNIEKAIGADILFSDKE